MDDRRKSPRYPLELHARCCAAQEAGGFHVMVTEISPEGMAITFFAGTEPGVNRRYLLEVDVPGKLEPVRVELIARQLHPAAGGQGYRYVAGGELAAISPGDLQMLLEYGRENRLRHDEQTAQC